MNGKNYRINIPANLKTLLIIISSNLLFYLLFFPSPVEESSLPTELVEVKIEARLMTSFHNGKKVTLHHSPTNQNIEAHLISPADEEGLITVATGKDTVATILTYQGWKIIPPIKLQITHNRGESREIKY